MSLRLFRFFVFVPLILCRLASVAPAQPPADPATVKLPPLIVEDSKDQPRWLYVSAGGTEYLSLCSTGITESYVDSQEHMMQLVRVLVPEAFWGRMDAGVAMVLYPQNAKNTAMTAGVRAMLGLRPAAEATDLVAGPLGFLPNLRIDDRDTNASFAYIDEARFEADRTAVAANYVRYLVELRTPLLPGWAVEGIDLTYRNAYFMGQPIGLSQLRWIDRTETQALLRNPDRSRLMLSGPELFAPDTLRGESRQHPLRVATLKSQVALFFRWAIESGPETREALWKFVARSAEEPVTEKMFTDCFGSDYAELRDQLSDYLVRAVRETPRLEPGKLPPLPRIRARPATPNEIARIRGEWERMAIRYVKDSLPQYTEPYSQQARRTLRRAYDTGDRDPRLLATMGLLELDQGDEVAARPFLESAIAAGVVRPRVYYEIARQRFTALKRDQPPSRLYTYAELAAVFDPLRRAAQQAPALPEVFGLFAEVWVRCNANPEPRDVALLQLGARYFSRRGNVSFPIALALARHGRATEADALLALGFDYLPNDELRARFTKLRADLKSAPGH